MLTFYLNRAGGHFRQSDAAFSRVRKTRCVGYTTNNGHGTEMNEAETGLAAKNGPAGDQREPWFFAKRSRFCLLRNCIIFPVVIVVEA
jgi:hypothetical protein